jgi:insulysin
MQSGASVVVKAGSWQDPKDFPGMAHFLEHLLFMGSKAYPIESDYQEYILDRGGNFNAMTFHDRTLYAFSIQESGFEGALDRFSHFFIDPLLSNMCIKREINAVNHEFEDSLNDDFIRMWRIFKATGNVKHPNAVFSIGNKESLANVSEKEMRKWFDRYYATQNMRLLKNCRTW